MITVKLPASGQPKRSLKSH